MVGKGPEAKSWEWRLGGGVPLGWDLRGPTLAHPPPPMNKTPSPLCTRGRHAPVTHMHRMKWTTGTEASCKSSLPSRASANSKLAWYSSSLFISRISMMNSSHHWRKEWELGLLMSSSPTAAPISRNTSTISVVSRMGNEYTSFVCAIALAKFLPPRLARPPIENDMPWGGSINSRGQRRGCKYCFFQLFASS